MSKIGETFGNWTVISKGSRYNYYLCECKCGNKREVFSSSLVRGKSTSCGCNRTLMLIKRNYIHGKSKTKEFRRLYQNNRRCMKLKATPIWADRDNIKSVYEKCPEGMEVDHIIPLQSKLVCGLHVESNLQYLSPSDNYKKNNSFSLLS